MRTGGRREDRGGRTGRRSPPSPPTLDGVTITLSSPQVLGVLRAASGDSGTRELLLEHIDELRIAVDAALENPELNGQIASRSTFRALGVLCAFAPPGTTRGINEVARERGLAQGTAHRYAHTLVAVGLLEQVTSERKYRMPLGGASGGGAGGTG